jgi:proliferating cell nuclear antigen
MFKARVKAEALKDIIDATSILVDEAKFRMTIDGIYLRAVDPAHVGMIDLKLGKKAFEEYESSEMELGIDLEKMKDVMKLASPQDVVDLDYSEREKRLIVKIDNLTRRMGLIDTSAMTDPKMPSLDLPAKIVMKTSELARGIKASEAISDHLTLLANAEGFELSAEGDTDTVKLKLPKDSLPSLECQEEVKSLFSLDYFSDMVKAAKGEGVAIYLGNDFPVKIEFDIAEGEGHVLYLLAPRIESE